MTDTLFNEIVSFLVSKGMIDERDEYDSSDVMSALQDNYSEDVFSDGMIVEVTNRFLAWRLPEDFYPDGGISFDKAYKSTHGPSGTNLLNYPQAREMVRHILGVRQSDISGKTV